MGRDTGIGWCDHTFNPWWGCERVSPACAHCYADTFARRTGHDGTWGAGHSFRFFGDKHWDEPRVWNDRADRDGVRRRVFCASMADVFEERPELEEPRDRLFALIAETPALDWLFLTKRPEAMRDYMLDLYDYAGRWEINDYARDGQPLPNVWLGVSIENARWTWRADVLREIPAVVHFISAEPLLGSLFTMRRRDRLPPLLNARNVATPLDLSHIEWVIGGGESGPGYRPMNLDHARELRNACVRFCLGCQKSHSIPSWEYDSARPAFFFKQVGGQTPTAGGKLLDGREWAEFPEPQPVPA